MRTYFAIMLMAAAGLLAWAALPAQAGDTILLGGKDAETRTLVDDGSGADALTVARGGFHHHGFHHHGFHHHGFHHHGFHHHGFHHHGFHHHGFHHHGFHHHGFHHHGFHHHGFHHHGFHHGFHHRFIGFSGFGSSYYRLSYDPASYGYPYYSSAYSYPYFSSAYPYSYYPPDYSTADYADSAPYDDCGYSSTPYLPPALYPEDDSTDPDDRSPRNPVPRPRAEPAPLPAPPAGAPTLGRVVSLAKEPAKWVYPAYGEQPRRVSFVDRTVVTRNAVKKPSR